MRRKDKEITDRGKMEEILHKALVCRIALSENNMPYIVPVNYGYAENTLYFHSTPEGKKIQMLRSNNNVYFEVDVDARLIKDASSPCSGTMQYRSVMGKGKAFFIDDAAEKKKVLDIIMNHYLEGTEFEYEEKSFKKVLLIKIEISEMTGKISGI